MTKRPKRDAPQDVAPGAPEDIAPGAPEDIVLLGPALDEGKGHHILRKRGEQIERGEIRPIEDGKPLMGGELVRLEPRKAQPGLYDVRVEHDARPKSAAHDTEPEERHGPAQVATEDYRRGWNRLFGKAAKGHASN